MTFTSRPAMTRFMEKVKLDDGCWMWQGALSTKGYASFSISKDKGGQVGHRWIYEQMIGPIPDGLTLDHLCRRKACVNPMHLEPVTALENTARAKAARATCRQGHPYDDPTNIIVTGPGRRRCRACYLRYAREGYARRKLAAQDRQ